MSDAAPGGRSDSAVPAGEAGTGDSGATERDGGDSPSDPMDGGDEKPMDGGRQSDGSTVKPSTDVHAQLLQHCPYGGWHANLAVGDYTQQQLTALGFQDNDASSLRVSRGYELVLYEHDNFEGASVTVDTHQGCLTGVSFNDKVSSVRLRKKPEGPDTEPLRRHPPIDVTFFAVSDTHADPPGDVTESALRSTARAINKVAADGVWPTMIAGEATGFTSEQIGAPEGGLIFTGDLIGYSNAWVEVPTFERFFFPHGNDESVQFPGYLGLGNHDLADPFSGDENTRQAARDHMWNWVASHHKAQNAAAPVTAFDDGSRSYSWTVGGVHFVQLHRFPGDDEFGHPTNLPFLESDLEQHASDGKPVFLFHHYGFDPFGAQDRWWTPQDRQNYAMAIAPYNVGLIVAGHWHEALQVGMFEETNPSDTRVLHVNDIKLPRPGTVQDGNGSFSIVRVTDKEVWVVNCRWLNENGDYELIKPYYRGPTTLLK
jgi:cytolysin (calcineurin-like family phosphatase)